jgi:hypothetical protein
LLIVAAIRRWQKRSPKLQDLGSPAKPAFAMPSDACPPPMRSEPKTTRQGKKKKPVLNDFSPLLLKSAADLHSLHCGLSLFFRRELSVLNNCYCWSDWLCINDGAFFGRRVPNNIEISRHLGLGVRGRHRENSEGACSEKLLHGISS